MKNSRRILAVIGIVLLLALCISPLIFAVFVKNANYFRASFASIIIVPIFLYAILLVYKHVKPQKSPLIDNIIFDVGNVLISFEWKKVMGDLGFSPETVDYLDKNLIHDPLWKQFDEGLRPYDEVTEEFCQKNPAYEKEIRTFLSHMPESIVLRSYTHAWLADLKKKGYNLYIISNWAEPVYENCKNDTLSFEKYMDGAIWSYRAKCLKPSAKIYKMLLKTYGLDPSRSVFLDDVQENLDGAKKQGILTILVTEDHKNTLAELRKLGIK